MDKQSDEQLEVKEWMALRDKEPLCEKCGRRVPLSRQLWEKWKAICQKAGRKINPETAEVFWEYAQTLDPYGIDPNLPEEFYQVGREYFARSPGSDFWIWFNDLPAPTVEALRKRLKEEREQPAF